MNAASDLPDPDAMAAALRARLPAFGDVAWTLRTGSTNADLLARARHARDAGPRPWLLGAHLQEAGRGRAGRPWQNRIGAALMVSCAFDIQMAAARLPAISPAGGIAACEALRALAGPAGNGIRMKWPNDVQLGPAKLAGVLVETIRRPDSPPDHYVVVLGMGLNLADADTLSQQLGRDIADWSQAAAGLPSSQRPAPEVIAAEVAQAWHEAVQTLASRGFDDFVARHAALDALAERAVNVVDNGRVVLDGRAQGIDLHGRLQVLTAQGMTVPVSVGEISVRARS